MDQLALDCAQPADLRPAQLGRRLVHPACQGRVELASLHAWSTDNRNPPTTVPSLVGILLLCLATEEERPDYSVCASRHPGVHLNCPLDLKTQDASKENQPRKHPEVFIATAVGPHSITGSKAGPRDRGYSVTADHRSAKRRSPGNGPVATRRLVKPSYK